MLLLEDDVDGEYPRAPDGRGEQEGVPRTDESSSPPEGPQQMRVSHHGRQQPQGGQRRATREGEREDETALTNVMCRFGNNSWRRRAS